MPPMLRGSCAAISRAAVSQGWNRRGRHHGSGSRSHPCRPRHHRSALRHTTRGVGKGCTRLRRRRSSSGDGRQRCCIYAITCGPERLRFRDRIHHGKTGGESDGLQRLGSRIASRCSHCHKYQCDSDRSACIGRCQTGPVLRNALLSPSSASAVGRSNFRPHDVPGYSRGCGSSRDVFRKSAARCKRRAWLRREPLAAGLHQFGTRSARRWT